MHPQDVPTEVKDTLKGLTVLIDESAVVILVFVVSVVGYGTAGVHANVIGQSLRGEVIVAGVEGAGAGFEEVVECWAAGHEVRSETIDYNVDDMFDVRRNGSVGAMTGQEQCREKGN